MQIQLCKDLFSFRPTNLQGLYQSLLVVLVTGCMATTALAQSYSPSANPIAAAGYGAYALANAEGTPQIPAEGGYAAAPPATSPVLPPEQAQPSYASAAPLAPGPAF